MKICILNDTYLESSSPFAQVDSRADPTPYLGGHQVEHIYLMKRTSVAQVESLVAQEFDVFINLCDGAPDEDRPGIEVVQALEEFGVAFTGADSGFYNPSRLQMKQACQFAGIPSPGFAFVEQPNTIIAACRHLKYPLIVKHPNSYGSIGLSRYSKVRNKNELVVQAQEMIARYGGTLVEEFISRKEFSVLVAENPDDPMHPVTFTPVEVQFPAGEDFKHFDIKWQEYGALCIAPCTDAELASHLRRLSSAFFVALNGVSYGRCDLRVDHLGNAFMLEINPNCGLFYPATDPGMADVILFNDPMGHGGFMDLVLRAAMKRKRINNPKTANGIQFPK